MRFQKHVYEVHFKTKPNFVYKSNIYVQQTIHVKKLKKKCTCNNPHVHNQTFFSYGRRTRARITSANLIWRFRK